MFETRLQTDSTGKIQLVKTTVGVITSTPCGSDAVYFEVEPHLKKFDFRSDVPGCPT